MSMPEMKFKPRYVRDFLVFCNNTVVGRVKRSGIRYYMSKL